MQYPIQSLLVFNYDNKAVPVAWIISPSFSSGDTHRWMRALFNKVCIKDPTWKLAVFIVDDPLTDVLTISFMEILVECKEFMDYFKASWYPRIGSWITTLKMMPIASLESSAALEFYHNQLKIRFLNEETDSGIYKRADWLVNKLSTKIHTYIWLDEYEGKDDFSRNRKDEWASDFTSWHKSRTIPKLMLSQKVNGSKLLTR
ncbi:hypothetical protein Tco_1505769 [Tanacetum coccineum]